MLKSKNERMCCSAEGSFLHKEYLENLWLCCDDLKGPKCQWKRRAPNISPKQIHMIMWEKQGRAPSSSPEDQQRWLSRQLDLIYNEDAMLSGKKHCSFKRTSSVSKSILHYTRGITPKRVTSGVSISAA